MKKSLEEMAAYSLELWRCLHFGKQLIESSIAHVSHGGPTKLEAEEWVKSANHLLVKGLFYSMPTDSEKKIKGSVARRSGIMSKHWGPDDDYLVVQEFQVFAEDGFVNGDQVEVTVTKIERDREKERENKK